MTHTKTILLLLIFTFILIAPLTAKAKKSKASEQATNENPVVTEAKTIFSQYAGLPELKNRGFDLSMFDSANTMEDVYNILLPYMIVDGVPLDKSIYLYDLTIHKQYGYRQHYTVHFTDDYGTKEELSSKGYKDDEILAYYSKGKDVYRGGHFVWEKDNDYTDLNCNMPKLTPVTGEKYIYFWVPNFNMSDFYKKYWKEAAKKDYIILDMRLLSDGPTSMIQSFFKNLQTIKYKGVVLILIDSFYPKVEWVLTGDVSPFITSAMNDEEKTSEFKVKCLTIGKNTNGYGQNFNGSARLENNERIWSVPNQINKWKKVDEGVGLMPDIWTEKSEDCYKTIEVITGINDFKTSIEFYDDCDKIFSLLGKQRIQLDIPKYIMQLKKEDEIMDNFSEMLQVFKRWYDYCHNNEVKPESYSFGWWLQGDPVGYPKDEYLKHINNMIDQSIERNENPEAMKKGINYDL